jgi:hypothetical protein
MDIGGQENEQTYYIGILKYIDLNKFILNINLPYKHILINSTCDALRR